MLEERAEFGLGVGQALVARLRAGRCAGGGVVCAPSPTIEADIAFARVYPVRPLPSRGRLEVAEMAERSLLDLLLAVWVTAASIFDIVVGMYLVSRIATTLA